MVVLHCKRVLSSPGPERARCTLTLFLPLVGASRAPPPPGGGENSDPVTHYTSQSLQQLGIIVAVGVFDAAAQAQEPGGGDERDERHAAGQYADRVLVWVRVRVRVTVTVSVRVRVKLRVRVRVRVTVRVRVRVLHADRLHVALDHALELGRAVAQAEEALGVDLQVALSERGEDGRVSRALRAGEGGARRGRLVDRPG